MSMDAWTVAALVTLLLGVAAAFAGRWRAEAPDFSRALIITAFAIYVSGAAWRTHEVWIAWFSGFVVCAALHRWADAISPLLHVKGADQ